MIAVKENREYTITEDAKESFIKEGYDIYDNNGNVVAYGAGKTVPFERFISLAEKYAAIEEENYELRRENSELNRQLKESTKRTKTSKKKGE